MASPLSYLAQSTTTSKRRSPGFAPAEDKPKPEFICKEIDSSTGKLCNKTFSRAFNLKRHNKELHQSRAITTFINWDGHATTTSIAAQKVSSVATPELCLLEAFPQSMTSTLHLQGPLMSTDAVVTNLATTLARPTSSYHMPTCVAPTSKASPEVSSQAWCSKRSMQETALVSPTISPFNNHDLPLSPDRPQNVISSTSSQLSSIFSTRDVEHQIMSSQASSQSLASKSVRNETDPARRLPHDSNHTATATEIVNPSIDSLEFESPAFKRRRVSNGLGRVIDARVRNSIPEYMMKSSKKVPEQQRGLDWLKFSSKNKFDETYKRLLAGWGVKPNHKGTCVLLAEDWKALEPVKHMEMLESHGHPSSGAGRAWYSQSDHATTLARALAWFGVWPRKGIELDNFLGCGPFQPKDASHLCHHEHCIIHLVYESAATNQDRNECCHEARFLRQEGKDIPEHCARHSPPCLMQVSRTVELTKVADKLSTLP